jgi:hypothetical protein
MQAIYQTCLINIAFIKGTLSGNLIQVKGSDGGA